MTKFILASLLCLAITACGGSDEPIPVEEQCQVVVGPPAPAASGMMTIPTPVHNQCQAV